MSVTSYGDVSWERMIQAVENVRRRLLRATSALGQAGVPYAVIGGNAVAAWVSRVDQAAVRNTQDVDILLRRADLGAATAALIAAGFAHRETAGVNVFLDHEEASPRDAVHVIIAGEKVLPHYAYPTPDVGDAEATGDFRVASLESIVRMKLTSFRDKDRTHLRDLLDNGLIGSDWLPRLPVDLAERLKALIDNPDG